uniref:Isochorismatase-like domain-containing protein n=1 Tax=Phaeomonas parva TaxID=124430 RepID=A0A7S1U003_9STRA|mmetsp:Transcript_25651/g.80303  ORF Transcript_25651/g.80303 Transcript_25651/m.80303 type:complete len:252 (+) Transcript_25651:102-857(+)
MRAAVRALSRPPLGYRLGGWSRVGTMGLAASSEAPPADQRASIPRKRSYNAAMARCNAEDSVLFVCDLQDRFQSLIHEFETVANASAMLVKTAREMEMPIVVTEQYPERLGSTVAKLMEAGLDTKDPDARVSILPKTRFSMIIEDNPFRSYGRGTVIVCGIETHVCVLQTVLDLLEEGYTVFVVRDAVSSMRKNDRSAAIERLQNAGAVISTSESVVFDLMRDSKHPKFRNISKLVRARNSEVNNFATEDG